MVDYGSERVNHRWYAKWRKNTRSNLQKVNLYNTRKMNEYTPSEV